MRLGKCVWASLSLRNGLPRTNRRAAVESLDTRAKSKPDGRWPSESGSVPSARVRHRHVGKDCQVRVVVMGCGRVGASLSDSLARIGHDVAVIDRDSTAFHRLSPEFPGERVLGMGFDRDVLLRAGIEEAGAFAAVSSGDNSNIISARVARETFGVERVVARIYDAKRAAVYERLGIPTVATVPWTADEMLRRLLADGAHSVWSDPSGSVGVTELAMHEDWVGHRITALETGTGGRVG